MATILCCQYMLLLLVMMMMMMFLHRDYAMIIHSSCARQTGPGPGAYGIQRSADEAFFLGSPGAW